MERGFPLMANANLDRRRHSLRLLLHDPSQAGPSQSDRRRARSRQILAPCAAALKTKRPTSKGSPDHGLVIKTMRFL